MPTPPILLVFAALCGIFFFAIGGVAVWEWIRFSRGESALSARHLRWRLLSAFTWLVVLGAFFVATMFLWPQHIGDRAHQSPADIALARRFALVIIGAMLLMVFAFVLMAVDIFWTVQVGRKSVVNQSRQSQEALRRELERTANRRNSNETS
ncbi:hypothetical protein IAD21_01029 [Abditibacteriota bacterium]|nr:hypothetical protein IAD21_01029 [Abditibacteriota bacterium]